MSTDRVRRAKPVIKLEKMDIVLGLSGAMTTFLGGLLLMCAYGSRLDEIIPDGIELIIVPAVIVWIFFEKRRKKKQEELYTDPSDLEKLEENKRALAWPRRVTVIAMITVILPVAFLTVIAEKNNNEAVRDAAIWVGCVLIFNGLLTMVFQQWRLRQRYSGPLK